MVPLTRAWDARACILLVVRMTMPRFNTTRRSRWSSSASNAPLRSTSHTGQSWCYHQSSNPGSENSLEHTHTSAASAARSPPVAPTHTQCVPPTLSENSGRSLLARKSLGGNEHHQTGRQQTVLLLWELQLWINDRSMLLVSGSIQT